MPSLRARSPVLTEFVMIRPALNLDLDVHTSRQVELHQRVHSLRGRIDDIKYALVRTDFKLLAGSLVHVRRTVNGETPDQRRQSDRPPRRSTRSLGRINDCACGMVQYAVIEGLEPYADILTIHVAHDPSYGV